MKRILSLLIAAVLVFSMLPAVSFATEVRTVYWDPVGGSDTGNGLGEKTAVKTATAAYAALSGADEGRIVMLSTASFTAITSFPVSSIPVTITSKTGAEGITSTASLNFQGETTLEKLTLTLNKNSTSVVIGGGGRAFTIGEGVTCVPWRSKRPTPLVFPAPGSPAYAAPAMPAEKRPSISQGLRRSPRYMTVPRK